MELNPIGFRSSSLVNADEEDVAASTSLPHSEASSLVNVDKEHVATSAPHPQLSSFSDEVALPSTIASQTSPRHRVDVTAGGGVQLDPAAAAAPAGATSLTPPENEECSASAGGSS